MKAITTILATLAFAGLATYAADPAKGAGKPKMDPEKAFAKKDANSDGKIDDVASIPRNRALADSGDDAGGDDRTAQVVDHRLGERLP